MIISFQREQLIGKNNVPPHWYLQNILRGDNMKL